MSLKNRSLQAAFLFVGVFAIVATVPPRGLSQDAKKDDKDKPVKADGKDRGGMDLAPGALKKYTGFTRPGAPGDRLGPDKAVIEAAIKDDDEDAFGCTIYFAVYENQGDKAPAGDTFGTGLKDFDTTFRRGKGQEGTSGPALSKKAKYLYLYQTVNDRGTPGVITSTAIRLVADPRVVSSWGFLPGMGFAARPKEWELQRKLSPLRAVALERGGVLRAAFDLPKDAIAPVSYDVCYASAAQPENRLYREKAPAVVDQEIPLLTRIPTRKESEAMRANPLVQAALEKAIDPIHEPDLVLLDTKNDAESDNPYVRAYFFEKNALSPGDRSSVFGFTSDYPPIMDSGTVRAAKREKMKPLKEAIPEEEQVNDWGQSFISLRTAQAAQAAQPDGGASEFAEIPKPAAGGLPTPTAPPGGGGGGGGAGAPNVAGPLGGQGSGAGGGVGGGLGTPAGFGAGRGASSGGGGASGGGTGTTGTATTGTQGQQGQQAQQQQQQQPTSGLPSINLLVQQTVTQNTSDNQNQSETQSETQSENQSETQSENQSENQTNQTSTGGGGGGGGGGCGCGQVVPEPAAFVLAAMGLPFLVYVVRRRKTVPTSLTV